MLHVRLGILIFTHVSIPRLLSVLAALALLIAPLAMLGGNAAMAGHMPSSAMAKDHCTGTDGDHQPPMVSPDCAIACAVMTPAEMPVVEKQAVSVTRYHATPLAAFHGLEPKAEIPPPRFS